MVEIPKRGGWGGGPLFGKNSQKIPYFFPEAFPKCVDHIMGVAAMAPDGAFE